MNRIFSLNENSDYLTLERNRILSIISGRGEPTGRKTEIEMPRIKENKE